MLKLLLLKFVLLMHSGQRGIKPPLKNGTPSLSSTPLLKMKIPQPPLFPRFKFHPPFFWPSFDKLLQSLSIFQRLLKWRIQWCGSDGRNYFLTDTVNMNSQICKQSYWKYEKFKMSGKNSFAKFQILQAPLKKSTPPLFAQATPFIWNFHKPPFF